MAGETLAAQYADDWGRVENDLRSERLQAAAIGSTVVTIGDDALEIVRRVTGGDLKLRNYPRRGRADKVRVKSVVRGDSGRLMFQPAGLWAIIEEGASPHKINGRSGRRVVIPLGGRAFTTSPVNHPGMGKLGRPVKRSTDKLGDVLDADVTDEIDRRVR